MKAQNIPVTEDMIVYGDYSEYSREIVGKLLDDNPDADAIIFSNDQMAIGGYQELKSRNIRIGADISVIGFDNSPGSVTMVPPLTTVNANTPAYVRYFHAECTHMIIVLQSGNPRQKNRIRLS